ncbi:hypothetical protein FHX68_2825 [Microbacterium lacticum]|uniref:Uncharacterized protein n=1 Tax=Microbacterium lacticum TaxID=33885 RepID=A0A543K7A4_9MICO|nr:hypothetical protein FHX68_2825 [Microbacterium lacticum]
MRKTPVIITSALALLAVVAFAGPPQSGRASSVESPPSPGAH